MPAPLLRLSELARFWGKNTRTVQSWIRQGRLAAIRSPPILFVLQPLHAVSFGLVWLAQVTYASRRFPPQLLATAQGLFATAFGLGSAVGMVMWGVVYQRGGSAFMFAGAAFFAVCASAFAVALDRRVRAPVEGQSATTELFKT